MHICYGYGIKANIEWKKTLGSEWRQYEQTFPRLAASTIDQVSLECAHSHVPIDLIGLLEGKDVLVGAIDVASDRIETPEEVADVIRAALEFVPAARLLPCTNCGMVPLARDVARRQAGSAGRRRRTRPAGIDVLTAPTAGAGRVPESRVWRGIPRNAGGLPGKAIAFLGNLTYSVRRVLFQAVKACSVRPPRSRSTAVLSLRSKHRPGNVPFIFRT